MEEMGTLVDNTAIHTRPSPHHLLSYYNNDHYFV